MAGLGVGAHSGFLVWISQKAGCQVAARTKSPEARAEPGAAGEGRWVAT